MPHCCKRCFYIKLKLNQKLPWQIFPGIFSSIDSYSKNITWTYFEKYKKLPPWFSPFGDFIEPISVPHHNRFYIIDEKTNIRLTGTPDDIFRKRDNSYSIIDYKTARFSKYQDKLFPIYKVQLNGYALIGNKVGFNPVSSLLLIYYEPQTHLLDEKPEEIISVMKEEGFLMPFMAHILEVELEPEGIVEPLLEEVRRLGDMEDAPEGAENCEDCRRLGEVIQRLP